MKRSGSADLPLHYGSVPTWLLQRMSRLSLAITETILADYGRKDFLRRLSDPFWFQSFGAVTGMDWHSSGMTTSIMGVLKSTLNPLSKDLGIYVCGGKGNLSRNTPAELLAVSEKTGLNGTELVRCSKLSAKVDNTAVQDGYNLYLHNFIVTTDGDWVVIQQGMDTGGKTARRYHWHSESMQSFLDDPHTAVCGINQGSILNLADTRADKARSGMLDLTKQSTDITLKDVQKLVMPAHHDVQRTDVDMKRLGALLWLAHDRQVNNFEELLLLEGAGPRTIQSLALVSEVIHGAPTRFTDPARFSFAHGGKDGHPFPVPLKTYDETISILENAVNKAKLANTDKQEAIKKLHQLSLQAEKNFTPSQNGLDEVIKEERENSWKYDGQTVFGKVKKPESKVPVQLSLFN